MKGPHFFVRGRVRWGRHGIAMGRQARFDDTKRPALLTRRRSNGCSSRGVSIVSAHQGAAASRKHVVRSVSTMIRGTPRMRSTCASCLSARRTIKFRYSSSGYFGASVEYTTLVVQGGITRSSSHSIEFVGQRSQRKLGKLRSNTAHCSAASESPLLPGSSFPSFCSSALHRWPPREKRAR